MNKSISFKKYVKLILISLVIFLSYHVIVWTFYTSRIYNLEKNNYVGDLGRMSYLVNSLDHRIHNVDLKKRHYYKDNYQNQEIDIVTLGDSFFNGGAGGKNAYIQDYLATQTNLNILNVLSFDSQQSPIKLIENMIDVGWFKKYKPKYLILETVEKSLPGKFNLKKELKIGTLKELERKIQSPGQSLFTYVPQVKIINTANYKLPYFNLMYNFKEKAQRSVYKLSLNDDYFSVKDSDSLLCYNEEIEHIEYFTDQKLDEINDKINLLSKKLKEQNVELIFLVAVDKYDLYYDKIINNKYKKQTFFERFEKLNKDYIFINTKKVLKPLIDNKVLDVFYADDTHWSYKANEAVSSYIKDRLEENKRDQ